MRIYNLKDVCNITTGKLDANQSVRNGAYPFFTCAEYPEKIDSYSFDCDAVLVAGNNARGNFHVNRYNGKFNAYQRTYVLTIKENFDINFVYYSLKLELKRLKEKSQGSQTKFLTLPILQNIQLPNIAINKQKSIASVLSALDQKIAINHQINAQLEQMAKTLYDYWFVQFDFPDENGKPYQASGGEMVYNDTLKRHIPKGWEVKSLGEIEPNIVTGKTPSTQNENYFNGNIPFITIGDIRNNDTEQKLSNEGANTQINKYLPEGSLCVSCIATVGLIGFTTEKSQCNQQINSIIFDIKIHKPYFYFYLKNYFLFGKAKTGNTFSNMNKNDFSNIKIIYPNKDILEKYFVEINKYFEEIKNLSKQNQQLTQLRDFLLPMLMNGQVSISDVQVA